MQGADGTAQGVHLRVDEHRGDADRGDGAGVRKGDGAGSAQDGGHRGKHAATARSGERLARNRQVRDRRLQKHLHTSAVIT